MEAYAKNSSMFTPELCTELKALGPRRVYDEMLIQRRGLGFCSDDVTRIFQSQRSFCFLFFQWPQHRLKMFHVSYSKSWWAPVGP